MYCKHCGNQIADDSVFCSKCGKLVIETNHQTSNQPTTNNVINWVNTENLQWKKPIDARRTQIIFLIILGLLLLYPLYCFVSGGEVEEYSFGWKPDARHDVTVYDPWELNILEFTTVNMSNRNHGDNIIRGSFSRSDAQNIFRWKMLLVLFPLIALLWLTIRWMQSIRFPQEKDILPRDVADEIEQYNWDGFAKYKYVFFKKDGKYGIIDARNYSVYVPAQYDSIVWRMPNKTFDVTIGSEKRTIAVKKPTNSNPSKTIKTICVFVTSLTFICTIFAFIVGEETVRSIHFTIFLFFAIITFFAFKLLEKKDTLSFQGHNGGTAGEVK